MLAGFAHTPQAVGRIEARHCVAGLNYFSIDLIPRK
jgi:hypothetical protein